MATPVEPEGFPPSIQTTLEASALEWRNSPSRPRAAPAVAAHWDSVVAEWVATPTLPLFVRKSMKGTPRGLEVRHASGRSLIYVDNSPAHWTLASAIAGQTPTVAQLLAALECGEWPVMFIASKAETAALPRYRGILSRSAMGKTLNDAKWKVCHIHPVGLRSRTQIESFPLEALLEHCRRLLSPSNMFVVPTSHGGFGELPEVIKVFRGGL